MRETEFRPSIQGLRGLAVLMVVLYHWSHIRGGFIGVDIFFVISGYLISGHLEADLHAGTFSGLNFYAKRAKRIFPALALVLFASFVLAWGWGFEDQLRQIGKHIQSGALFVSNYRLSGEAGYFDAAAETKPLLHLWSLAIEEQFYLLWPWVLWAAFRMFGGLRFAVLVVTVLSFGWNIYLSGHDAVSGFYSLSSRLWELSAGYLFLATRERGRRFYDWGITQVAGIALILLGGMRLGSDGFPGFKALIPVIGVGLLLGASEKSWVNRRILSSRALVFFGSISYPLYLWHWPLFVFMKTLMLHDVMWALTGLTLLLAYTTHVWVEKPVLSLKITFRNRVSWVAVCVGALGCIALLGTYTGSGGIRGLGSRAHLPTFVDLRSGKNCSINGDAARFFVASLSPCQAERYPGAPWIVLLGDSHAGSLSDGLDELAQTHHFNLATLTAIYCTPLSTQDHRVACRDFNRYLETWIAQLKPDLVILVAHHLHWPTDSAYGEAVAYPEFIVSRLRQIQQATGNRVLLVGQNPTWEISLPHVLEVAFLARSMPIPERTLLGLDGESAHWDWVMKAEATRQSIPYFSIRDELCTNAGCRVRAGDDLASDLMDFDYGHLSHRGSLYVVENGLGMKISTLLTSHRSRAPPRQH